MDTPTHLDTTHLATTHQDTTHQDALDELLAVAADAPLAWPGWQLLRQRARTVTEALVADGRLAAHLVVALDDPPAVVTRLLAHAVRGVDTTPGTGRTVRTSGAA